jgi:hypothetical protein
MTYVPPLILDGCFAEVDRYFKICSNGLCIASLELNHKWEPLYFAYLTMMSNISEKITSSKKRSGMKGEMKNGKETNH